ncbi:MAG: EAL domain-containing protein [Pseudomonadota bacterium]
MNSSDAPPSAEGDAFVFAPEDEAPRNGAGARLPLTILTVDDDSEFQRSLHMALANYEFQTQPLRLLSAGSASEAAAILSATPEVSVIILDVVMETDDAGLRLVKSVREMFGNAEVRIVLVTGQPGVTSLETSLSGLDISDYWLKTDLSQERLHGIMSSNLRTWQQIHALSAARRGLQAIVEASNNLHRASGLQDFSERMVRELCHLLRVPPEGVVCVQKELHDPPLTAHITGAAGRFAATISRNLAALDHAPIRDLLVRALVQQSGTESDSCQVLFFPAIDGSQQAAVYIATGRPLDATERELLRVFATNIHSGLINVSLVSRLDRTAYEDSLLAMPNANALLRNISAVLDMPAPRDRVLLFIDLNLYSESCLSLGIEQGDLLLRQVARRLLRLFPAPCMVARIHDDTFAILGPGAMLDPSRIGQLESLDPEDLTHPPFISVGAARVDLDLYDRSARGALAVGTLLLRRARSAGLNQVVEYEPAMQRETDHRFARSRELYHALFGEDIQIELQPQVELATGRIVGAEALARWNRPDGSRVPPMDFIPIAEANGLIVELGRRVLELACRALARLRAEGFTELSMAVNVSPIQLAHRDFVPELLRAIARHGVPAEKIEIEITESTAMDYHANGAILHTLRDTGFPIAIDDFGTGYSSLTHLSVLPATTLKLDRTFVGQIDDPAARTDVAAMIIQLGRQLKLNVLAEGVETEAQAAWLLERGCNNAQGWLYGHPKSLDDFLLHLKQ